MSDDPAEPDPEPDGSVEYKLRAAIARVEATNAGLMILEDLLLDVLDDLIAATPRSHAV